MSDEQLYHALPKYLPKGSSELKLSSEEQPYHALDALVTEGSSVLKLVSDVQFAHEPAALVAVGSGVLNEVSPLCCHALLKFTFCALVPSFAPAGND